MFSRAEQKIKKIARWLQDEEKYYIGRRKKIENIGSLSQVRKIVWLNESIELKKSKKLASGFNMRKYSRGKK